MQHVVGVAVDGSSAPTPHQLAESTVQRSDIQQRLAVRDEAALPSGQQGQSWGSEGQQGQ